MKDHEVRIHGVIYPGIFQRLILFGGGTWEIVTSRSKVCFLFRAERWSPRESASNAPQTTAMLCFGHTEQQHVKLVLLWTFQSSKALASILTWRDAPKSSFTLFRDGTWPLCCLMRIKGNRQMLRQPAGFSRRGGIEQHGAFPCWHQQQNSRSMFFHSNQVNKHQPAMLDACDVTLPQILPLFLMWYLFWTFSFWNISHRIHSIRSTPRKGKSVCLQFCAALSFNL